MFPSEWTYQNKYVIRRVDRFEEGPCNELVRTVLGGVPRWEELLAGEELERHRALKKAAAPAMSFKLGVFLDQELVAFTNGWQSEDSVFYMGVSLVSPEHQRQGIYSELLRAVLAFTKKEGFQLVQSHHRATNNAVLIAKLRAGFAITGLELSDTMGALVRLSYFHNPERRKLLDVRVGSSRPDDRLRELFY